jgi:HD-GYP domain-containing protein (c-di-GMP phosphodiesterase class II)
MTTDRPYRNALKREEILKALNDEKDKQFDRTVVDALLSLTNNLSINMETNAVGRFASRS